MDKKTDTAGTIVVKSKSADNTGGGTDNPEGDTPDAANFDSKPSTAAAGAALGTTSCDRLEGEKGVKREVEDGGGGTGCGAGDGGGASGGGREGGGAGTGGERRRMARVAAAEYLLFQLCMMAPSAFIDHVGVEMERCVKDIVVGWLWLLRCFVVVVIFFFVVLVC